MSQVNIVVAIDGFSSCGKSTLAKQLATRLGITYVDSGAMYRATTLHFINQKTDIRCEKDVNRSLETAEILFEQSEIGNRIMLNGEDVTWEIRKMYVSEMVSKVSQLTSVRKRLVQLQQALGRQQSIIMDGRDIGTRVFPYAQVKLFMTADPAKRAERRHAELAAKDVDITLDQVLANLTQRDYDDTTRSESPLICAKDAFILDNTNLTLEQQFDIAHGMIEPLLKEAVNKSLNF
ncbi:(d)CMP kinase [Pedobacter deserti]|uniref:(d)CMP kinase n=1 Tax=Pedobacter deserti TaxID=2817382 RepID=UPI00210B9BF9|nr:(d)CMP kinase [Pedobacter sp. SYSU D00382]